MRRGICIVMVLVLLCGQGNVFAALQDGEGEGTGPNVNFSDLFTACEIEDYRSGDEYTYPTKEGYIFAGWYTNATYDTPISKSTKTGKYFPKFVHESVLTLKLQLTKDTTSTSEKTTLRLITSVDNLNYANVGFLIGNELKVSNTVYRTITGYTKDGMNSYKPNEVFHNSSNFFATMTLNDAMNDIEHHGTGDEFGKTVNVIPQWTTMDGTTVTGQGASFEINDYLYESELQGESHLWGTLTDTLNLASMSDENVEVDLLKNATVQTDSSYVASISAKENVTITVNGKGKTITTSGESDVFAIGTSEGEIEWQNVTIQHNGSASLFELNGSCDFKLNQVSITGNAENTGNEPAIIRTGEHCASAHVMEMITEGERTIAGSTETTNTSYITTEELVQNEQDKTVNITIQDSSINAEEACGVAGIRVMRGTIAHINISDSTIETNDILPLYVTGSDANYPTWRGMVYLTVDSVSAFAQGGEAVTTADMKINNAGMVALQEYTNRVIILADTHYMPEEDQEGNYIFNDQVQGLSLGHTQADRMKNILLDIKFFKNRQNIDSVLVLGDLGNDDYPTNKIGVNENGTFADITQNYVYKFKNEIMSKFQSDLGIASSWTLPGNHDSYTNSQWNEIMGYNRQYAKEIGNAVFVMLDNYYITGENGGNNSYSGVDIEWLKGQLDANTSWKGKPIFLCSHYYKYYINDSTRENVIAFQNLLTDYKAKGYQFVSMFMGHVHTTADSLQNYVDAENQTPLLITGGYAYNTASILNTVTNKKEPDYDAFYNESAWGFGVLEWNEHEAHYYHVKYDRTYVSTADDLVTDSKVSYGGAIENEVFMSY